VGFGRLPVHAMIRAYSGAYRMLGLQTRTYPYMEEVNEGIVRQFQRLGGKTGRVLDVGCGRGQLGEAIRALGWEVTGVEQSDAACETARGRLDDLGQADLKYCE